MGRSSQPISRTAAASSKPTSCWTRMGPMLPGRRASDGEAGLEGLRAGAGCAGSGT
ncbi:hypothetical protein M2163_006909 [Streptomyces sp. SAI-135]|uniref:hypothetical protein n=1 Tax=Streptomyces sp. SAI-135 TaxID=2940549 RepID=UPI002474DF3A|nr:hypothetical protein [Streptomyces sp. SAI-135]MDH6619801.1 hypothetical protein [Streptomyces sp. SAI-135]